MFATLTFALVAIAAQLIRRDLDPVRVPLSLYLTGAFGFWMRAAYYLLAGGLIALGWSSFRGADPAQRSAAPALLFTVAGLSLVAVAVTAIFSEAGDPAVDLARLLHAIAAQTTFLCVTVAMLLQCWRWQRAPGYMRESRIRWALAVSAFILLWVNVVNRSLPRGLMQKTLIALILIWLGLAAIQVWRISRRSQ